MERTQYALIPYQSDHVRYTHGAGPKAEHNTVYIQLCMNSVATYKINWPGQNLIQTVLKASSFSE